MQLRGAEARECGLVYDGGYLRALGAPSLLLESETAGKSQIAALQFFFLHKKVIFYFYAPPVHLFRASCGCRRLSRQNHRTLHLLLLWDLVVFARSHTALLRPRTKLGDCCVAWAAPAAVISRETTMSWTTAGCAQSRLSRPCPSAWVVDPAGRGGRVVGATLRELNKYHGEAVSPARCRSPLLLAGGLD